MDLTLAAGAAVWWWHRRALAWCELTHRMAVDTVNLSAKHALGLICWAGGR